jgi:hypothetical protein
LHKNIVLQAEGFDITVKRRRVYVTTAGSDVASGHASRLTNRQQLAVPHVPP